MAIMSARVHLAEKRGKESGGSVRRRGSRALYAIFRRSLAVRLDWSTTLNLPLSPIILPSGSHWAACITNRE